MSDPKTLSQFGFRLPPELPPINTGDAKLDAAIAMVEKKALSGAKKNSYDAIKLPARLLKPKPGDLERVLAILTPQAFDVGESTYDLTRKGDDQAEYLAAWRSCVLPRETRQGFISALVGYALLQPEGEAHVQPLLALGMRTPTFATMLIDTLLRCPRQLEPETMRTALVALENEGTPRDMYNSWNGAAQVAIALGPDIALEVLLPTLATEREKAVGDALRKASLTETWRGPLTSRAKQGDYLACELLVRLPPDAEALDAIAALAMGQAEAHGHVLSAWAHDWLVAHADDSALSRFPKPIADSVKAARL